MKVQLLAAVTILAFTSTAALASSGKGYGPKPKSKTTLDNYSSNALAIGDSAGHSGALGGFGIDYSGGRAVAGSILLTGGACACEFDTIINTSHNAIAVGNALAGSIQVSTTAK